MRKLSHMSAVVLLALATMSATPTLFGTPYEYLSCSQFVAKQTGRPHLWAKELWTVPTGYRLVSAAREGDYAVFHEGAHVAVFHNGVWLDSDPKHGGVGPMRYNPRDPWFRGEVRILRFEGK